jgi:glycosyltransferase involved in cell wall biosynthesis
MKIAVVTTSYPRGPEDPAGHFVRCEAQTLASAGHHVTVFAPSAASAVEPGNPRVVWLAAGAAFGAPGVLHRLSQAPWRMLFAAHYLNQLHRRLRREHFDEVVGHWLLPLAWPLLSHARAAEIVVHGSDLRLLLRSPRLLRGLCRWFSARGTTLRFVSQALLEDFLRVAAGAPIPVCTVSPSPITVPTLERATERRALGIDDEQYVVLVVGRLITGKRIDVALGHPVASGRRHLQRVVIGDGPLRRELEQRFPDVRFVGQLPRGRTLSWIAAADVVVNASLEEGAPTVIREARALGTRVHTTRVGDVAGWALRDPGIVVIDAPPLTGVPEA